MGEEEREETEGNMVELMFEDGNGAFTESENADLWRIVKALCAPTLDPRLAFPTTADNSVRLEGVSKAYH